MLNNTPAPQANIPLAKLLPDKTPTMLIPKIPSINNSAEPKKRINGFAIITIAVRTSAPNNPPINDAI